ncbi:putative cytochrome P450 [Helianthus annuus]|nr:putative cytochrome P450 [Helianthus annuus]
MDTWFLILASLRLAIIITSLMFHKGDSKKLPPGPLFFSSHLLLLTNSLPELQSTTRRLKSKYGPLVTLSIVSHPSVFIESHSLAHQVLIPKGTTSSDLPKFFPLHGISTASYGPNWRAFRHNLASSFLRGSHVKSYSWDRKWALQRLIGQLQVQQEGVGTIKKLDDRRVNSIASVNGGLHSLVGSMMFNVIFVSPLLAKIMFRNKWNKLDKLRSDQNQLLIPLIKYRKEAADTERNVAYIDTLLKQQLPEDDPKLTETEMVSMCGEFLLAATEATSSALQWIMANLVNHPSIQSKLYDEIVVVVGPPPPPGARGVELDSVITEQNLKKIPYLKAVVLEGLRVHGAPSVTPCGECAHRVGTPPPIKFYRTGCV